MEEGCGAGCPVVTVEPGRAEGGVCLTEVDTGAESHDLGDTVVVFNLIPTIVSA